MMKIFRQKNRFRRNSGRNTICETSGFPCQEPTFSQAAWCALFDRLLDFMGAKRFRPEARKAGEIFWGRYFHHLNEIPEMYLDISRYLFVCWLFFDHRLQNGKRMIDRFLHTQPSLTPDEEVCLAQLRDTCLRLYEVTDVIEGEGFTLKELIDGEELFAREPVLSEYLKRWDILAARVIERGESGRYEIDCSLLHFDRSQRALILLEATDLLCQARFDNSSASEVDLMRTLTPFFHQVWLELVTESEVDHLSTPEGDDVLFTRVVFDVSDEGRLISFFEGCAALRRGPGPRQWTLFSEPNERFVREVLGWWQLHDGRLTLETMSSARAERGRALVEESACDCVEYRSTTHEDIAGWLLEFRGAEMGKVRPLSEGEREAFLSHLGNTYRIWLDQEIPALRYHTPRDAAVMKHLRPILVEILKDLENQQHHARQLGVPSIDVSWMWEELGLTAQ